MDLRFVKGWCCLVLSLLLSACMLDDDAVLEFAQVQEMPFVECYLVPGAPVKLSLFRTNSLREDISLQLISGAKVAVELPATTLLLQNKVHADSRSGKLYNYLTDTPLPKALTTDSIRLKITTAAGDTTLYAATALVEPLTIKQWSFQEQRLQLSCNNGSNKQNRYYSLFLKTLRGKEAVIRNMQYDYTSVAEPYISISVIIPADEKPRQVILYRITEENYHFQVALKKAVRTNTDPFEAPQLITGNIKGGGGMFTYFTADTLVVR